MANTSRSSSRTARIEKGKRCGRTLGDSFSSTLRRWIAVPSPEDSRRPVFAPNIPPRSRGYSMRALRNATALALAIPSILGAQRRAFVPSDWYRLTTVSAPAHVARRQAGRLHGHDRHERRTSGTPRCGWWPRPAGSRAVHVARASRAPTRAGRRTASACSSRRPGPASRARTWALRMDQPWRRGVRGGQYPRRLDAARDGRLVVCTDSRSGWPGNDATTNDRSDGMQAMARPPFGAIT